MGDIKVGVVVAFWKRKVLTYQALEQGEHMTGERFQRFLEDNVYVMVRERRIARPILLMDNARYHFSPIVKMYMDQRKWTVLSQDPYSPDENPCDSHGFRQLKEPLRGTRFPDRVALLEAFFNVCEDVSNNDRFSGIVELPKTWQAIVDNNGDYVN